jgi:hypothetical protein
MLATGDRALIAALGYSPFEVMMRLVFVIKLKMGWSHDQLHQNECTGADDLYHQFDYPRGPRDPGHYYEVPIPQTVREWIALERSYVA